MQFHNLTPFDALCFAALDPAGAEHRVIAMKVGYRLVPLQTNGLQGWQTQVIDDDPVPLCLADEHTGEPGASSVRQESDLAAYKPRCDVIINGNSFAPGGVASKLWQARLRVSALTPAPAPREIDPPQPLNPLMGLTREQLAQWDRDRASAIQQAQANTPAQVLLDKRVNVSGPAEFTRLPLLGWKRLPAQPALKVPLAWEHAFGGSSVVADPKQADAPPLLNEVCFSNPLGRGWMDARWLDQLDKARQKLPRDLPAPQLEYPDAELSEPFLAKHPKGPLTAAQMREVATTYAHRPAGFGFVGRAWAPRLALAGTYDDAWLEHHHPAPPEDFDFAYWNGAPLDQQITHLQGHVRIELWNLTDPKHTPSGYLSVELPAHRAFVLMRLDSGVMLPLPLLTDTVVIDTEAMTISLTHRTCIPAGTPVRSLEARFEIDPRAPLIRLEPTPGKMPAEHIHG